MAGKNKKIVIISSIFFIFSVISLVSGISPPNITLSFIFIIAAAFFAGIAVASRKVKITKKYDDRLDLAVSVSGDGIWDWKIASNEVFFDERWYTMAGYEPYEFPAFFAEWEKRVHPDDLYETNNEIRRCLNCEIDSFTSDFRFLNKSGEYRWVRAKAMVTQKDKNGKPLRFTGSHSDVHDLKTLEMELRSSKRNAAAHYRLHSADNLLEGY